jgi:hypothetical protein
VTEKISSVFVSHSRNARKFVDLLKPVLLRIWHELGIDFFQDVNDIHPGEEWEQKIDTAMDTCSMVLCFPGSEYFASNFIQVKEIPLIEHAFLTERIILCIPVKPTYAKPQYFISEVQWLSPPDQPLCFMDEKELYLFVVL